MNEILPEIITVVLVGSGFISSVVVLKRISKFENDREQARLFLPLVVGMFFFLTETTVNALNTLEPATLGDYAGLWGDFFLLAEALCFGFFLHSLNKALMPPYREEDVIHGMN